MQPDSSNELVGERLPTVRPVTTPGRRGHPDIVQNGGPAAPRPRTLQWRKASWSRTTSLTSLVSFDLPGNDDRVELNGAASEKGPIDGQTVGAPTQRSTDRRNDEKFGAKIRERPTQLLDSGQVALLVGNDPDFTAIDRTRYGSDLGEGRRDVHFPGGAPLGARRPSPAATWPHKLASTSASTANVRFLISSS